MVMWFQRKVWRVPSAFVYLDSRSSVLGESFIDLIWHLVFHPFHATSLATIYLHGIGS